LETVAIATFHHFVNDCSAQGFHPIYVNTGAMNKSSLSVSALEGMVGITWDLPAETTSNAAIQTMVSAVDAYQPGITDSDSWGPNVSNTWASGMLFAAAAKAGNLGDNATSAQVLNGLYALHAETLGGLAPPLTYVQGKPTTIGCWFLVGIKNHQWATPYGTQPYCESSAS
jgi:branched-chain amino acid transport system substrate-binding protein